MTGSLDTAFGHYRAGRLAEVIESCRALLRAEPGHADALNLLGVALFSSGEDGAAVAALGEAVRLSPGDAAARTNLAVVLQHRCEWRLAERHSRALAALEPGTTGAYSRLGIVLQEQGDLDGSAAVLRRAVRLDPGSALERFNLGTILILTGDFQGAMDAFRGAILGDPGGLVAHVRLGEMHLRLGQPDEAAVVCDRALRLDPADEGAINGLARCRRYRAAAALAGTAAAGVSSGGLVMRGAFGNATGYGHFCQRLIRTLRARSVPLQAIGVFGPEPWPDEPLDRAVPARAAVNCLIPLATEPVPGLATVTFTMFEGPCIPPAWRRQSESSDLIVVPTESSRLAWAAQGYPEDRLRICPLGVDPVPTDGGTAPTLVDPKGRLVSSYRHRFLNVSDFIARKNIGGLLRVWLRCTAATDDAVLILKLGKGMGGAMKAELGAMLRGAEEAAGKRLAEAAAVVLVDQFLSDTDMTGLYRAATHYWSMSHGEGWDLPMSKAGAMGLGLIAPRHSAYLDYLDEGVARLIPAAVGPAIPTGGAGFYPPFHGLDWWNPDEDAAAEILTAIIRGGDRLPSASERLLGRFTWDRSADRLLAILDEAGLRG